MSQRLRWWSKGYWCGVLACRWQQGLRGRTCGPPSGTGGPCFMARKRCYVGRLAWKVSTLIIVRSRGVLPSSSQLQPGWPEASHRWQACTAGNMADPWPVHTSSERDVGGIGVAQMTGEPQTCHKSGPACRARQYCNGHTDQGVPGKVGADQQRIDLDRGRHSCTDFNNSFTSRTVTRAELGAALVKIVTDRSTGGWRLRDCQLLVL